MYTTKITEEKEMRLTSASQQQFASSSWDTLNMTGYWMLVML